MSKFAQGKNAYAISDRSGVRYKYKDMRREWNGLLVGKDEYEPKHPQLGPFRRVVDSQALKDARPDQAEALNVFIFTDKVGLPVSGPRAIGKVNDVTVETNQADVEVDVTGISSTGTTGALSVQGDILVTPPGLEATTSVGSVTVNAVQVAATYTITVYPGSPSGNKFFQDGAQPGSAGRDVNEGSTYRYDQSDSTNSGHPLRFSTTADGTHGGGVEYTTGVVVVGTPGTAGAYTQITVATGAPTLYTYCTVHSGMGYKVNTL